MFDHLLSAEAKAFREEVRDLVKWVPRQMILDMDQDRIHFPKAFLKEAVVHELERCVEKKIARKKVSLPLVPSSRPGTLQLNADDIAHILSQEDQHALAGH